MKNDYLESGKDPFVEVRRNIFRKYYLVKNLNTVPTENYYVFIDSGFKRYVMDVASITVMQVGACIREPNGRLVSLVELIKEPPIDSYIVYTSRKRVEDRFKFDVKVMGLSEGNILVKHSDSLKVSELIMGKIDEFVSSQSRVKVFSKKPRFFIRLSKYITDLIELAYGLKVAVELRRVGVKPVLVLDGTLIKWFSIERVGKSNIDGFDIVIELLKSSGVNPDPYVVKELMSRTIGLAKTSKFTTLARCFELFNSQTSLGKELGLYTNVDLNNVVSVQQTLEALLKQRGLKEFVDETIKIFNRVVFDKNGYCVARFPLTSDGKSIFMVDLYVKDLVLKIDGQSVSLNTPVVMELNERLDKFIPELFSKRSALVGHPPLGYMEVDQAVRLPNNITKRFEELFESYLISRGELPLQPLIQAFQQSLRMRYGYR